MSEFLKRNSLRRIDEVKRKSRDTEFDCIRRFKIDSERRGNLSFRGYKGLT
jgi:hypothetical protein